MLKGIFYSIVSIIGTGLIICLYALFSLPNPETKTKIEQHEISTKLSSINQKLLIPAGYKKSSIYLVDDGFTSPHVEVKHLNKINIRIHSSNGLDYEGGKKVRTKILNNIKIREYQTKDKRVIYIFKVGQLNYLYEFHDLYRESIDEYLSKNIL
ncbi:hypothetical protein [Gottfriedia acidiceleris]|uniref:hypothetical protein n=1 Tax=Gottfriedia acidiceleris TaxID=371036 RepID=UPI00101D8CCB|nr:hypothetical protein [Gottfriedia acidiceleris]